MRGEVTDRNNAFAPSVAEFIHEVERRQEALDVETFWEKTAFVELDSPQWKAVCRARGGSMPCIERNGKSGWYVPKDELARVTPEMLEYESRTVQFRLPPLAFTAGDSDSGES